MKKSNKTIVIFQFSASFDGSGFSCLSLANGFKEEGWITHICFAHDGPILDKFRASGHQTHLLPHKSWLRRTTILHFLKDILEERQNAIRSLSAIRQLKPDLLYINTSVSLAGVLIAGKLGIPFIWHFRELFDNQGGELHGPPLLRSLIKKFFYRKPDLIVCNSRAVEKNLLETSGREKVHIIANPVEEAYFEIKETPGECREFFGLSTKATIIGIPGNIRPLKGHAFFLEAVAPVLLQHPDTEVIISGSGPEKLVESLRQQCAQLGIAPQVHFLGQISKMPLFFKSCDFVVIPSSSESFGRTAIEAFAAKVPVIATAVGGLKEIVSHGRNGIVVSYGDIAGLRQEIQNLVEFPEKGANLTSEAFIQVKTNYRESSYKDQITQLASRLVA